jgi:ion channel
MLKSDPTRTRDPVARGQGRFLYLLISLVLLLALLPLFPSEPFGHVISAALLTLVIAAGTQAVRRTRVYLPLALLLAIPAVIGQWLTFSLNLGFKAELVYHLLIVGFLALAIWTVLIKVLQNRRVSYDTLFGAASVYLLLGLLGACLFSLAELLSPASFWINPAHASESLGIVADYPSGDIYPQPIGLGQPGFALLIYYAFMTLTTVGYGDILPVAPLARTLAFLLATSGQLYLAILIARLVGLHIVSTSLHGSGTAS